MTLLEKIKKRLSHNHSITETNAEQAYDMWASDYDAQPNNLILTLDEKLFRDLLHTVMIKGKEVADIGCGTGRHWEMIYEKQPTGLRGYDISEEMLKKLRKKYPNAVTTKMTNGNIAGLKKASCDVIISNLTFGYIENIASALTEWHNALKNKGEIILTDQHPAILLNGGKRTFKQESKTIAIKNHLHTIEDIRELLTKLEMRIINYKEIIIDDSLRHYYELQNALPVFEKYKGLPLIYGMHIIKKNVAS